MPTRNGGNSRPRIIANPWAHFVLPPVPAFCTGMDKSDGGAGVRGKKMVMTVHKQDVVSGGSHPLAVREHDEGFLSITFSLVL